MKIVILDGFTANPGDLEWKELEKLGSLTVYDRTAESEITERCKDAEIILTNKTPLRRETLEELPAVKYIGVLATGYNVVDVDHARKKGITVTNVPSYSTDSVAQNVFALLLDITNGVAHYTKEVTAGKWSECEDFSYTNTSLTELSGKLMGIVGYGAIGRKVGEIALAMGMRVAAFTSKPQEEIRPVIKMDLDRLFEECDIVSLHCPLTESTNRMVNEERLTKMKKTAILINTGRGQLVDEEALAKALREDKIAAAGLDVMTQEPPRKDNPLLTAPNIRITPHISWATKEARTRLIQIAVANLQAYLAGDPINVV